MEKDFSYLRLVENYHPYYSSDDRGLECDILFRYLCCDEVSDDDLEWIHHDFADKKEVLGELKRLEGPLFSDSLNNFSSECSK